MNKEVIGIIGAGVAGCRLASLLASRSQKVLLFDHRAPWEKPCGGGLTFKIFREFKDLHRKTLGGESRRQMEMLFPSGRRINLTLDHGIYLVSRETLGRILLDRAVKAGAEFRPEKVRRVGKSGERFYIETDEDRYETDLLIGADGARSMVREEFSRPFDREDMILTYSAVLPFSARMPVLLKFFTGLSGYAWIFPRPEQTSIGIALEGDIERDIIVKKLEDFAKVEFERFGVEYPGLAKPLGRLLPNLRPETLADPGVAGKGWALAGDAAGCVDPITGEGIYYAFKTANLIHKAIEAGDLEEYGTSFQNCIVRELDFMARQREKFYSGKRLRALAIFLHYSPAVRRLTRQLISGAENYMCLKPRVKRELKKYVREVVFNFFAFKKGERKRSKR